MHRNSFFILVFIAAFGLQSCKKPTPPPIEITTSKAVFVLNEGNFMGGNASVSYRDLETGTVTTDLFQTANSFYLGDVGQSMLRLDDKLYIVVNNSGKIEVVNAADFKSVMTIQGLTSPRYLAKVGENKAYVTDLYAKEIAIVQLSSGTKIGQIPLPYWSEELVLLNGKVYVGTAENNKVYVVDPTSDVVTDSIEVGNSPGSLCADQEGTLWVLCYGSELSLTNGSMYKITQPGNVPSLVHAFPASLAYGSMLTSNRQADSLFVLASDVYRFPVSQPSFGNPYVHRNGRNFTALGYDSNSYRLYVADGKDFNQKGEVYVYDSQSALLDSFMVGVIPGMFLFGE
jgi:YVTN family beta-propeller protein